MKWCWYKWNGIASVPSFALWSYSFPFRDFLYLEKSYFFPLKRSINWELLNIVYCMIVKFIESNRNDASAEIYKYWYYTYFRHRKHQVSHMMLLVLISIIIITKIYTFWNVAITRTLQIPISSCCIFTIISIMIFAI